jgi:hypothetical protein
MLRSVKDLRGYTLHATDGEIGRVVTFYFDDRTWEIRYIVVETGNWLTQRRVLLAPVALGIPDWEERTIPVMLTQEQIKDSPSIDADKPVSRQMEEQIYGYYGWSPYWRISTTPLRSGSMAVAHMIAQERKEADADAQRPTNPNLRSTREVIGYAVHAVDGEIARVDDFIADDEMWQIRYVVVELNDAEKKGILSVQWIARIDWADRNVLVNLDKMLIGLAPEFDPEAPVNREYEVRLYDYYGRPTYWARV